METLPPDPKPVKPAFTPIPTESLKHPDGLTPAEFRVLVKLAAWGFNGSRPHPAIETLAQACEMGRRTVERCFASLESKGRLKRYRRQTKAGDPDTNEYDIEWGVPVQVTGGPVTQTGRGPVIQTGRVPSYRPGGVPVQVTHEEDTLKKTHEEDRAAAPQAPAVKTQSPDPRTEADPEPDPAGKARPLFTLTPFHPKPEPELDSEERAAVKAVSELVPFLRAHGFDAGQWWGRARKQRRALVPAAMTLALLARKIEAGEPPKDAWAYCETSYAEKAMTWHGERAERNHAQAKHDEIES